jgi:hypothetical protein
MATGVGWDVTAPSIACPRPRSAGPGAQSLGPWPRAGTPQTASAIVVGPCLLVGEVQCEPQLEARIRNRQKYPVLRREPSRFLETWMVLRPLHVEQTPEFVDLTLLASGSVARDDRLPNQSQRLETRAVEVDPDVHRRRLLHGGLASKRLEVFRLGTCALAEDQQRPAGLPNCDPTS